MPKYKGSLLEKTKALLLLLYINNLKQSKVKISTSAGLVPVAKVFTNTTLYSTTNNSSYILLFFKGPVNFLKKDVTNGLNYTLLCYYTLANVTLSLPDSIDQFKFTANLVKNGRTTYKFWNKGITQVPRKKLKLVPTSFNMPNDVGAVFNREFLSLWGRFTSYKDKQRHLITPE